MGGDYEKAYNIGISAAEKFPVDALEWELRAASGAQLAGRMTEALATYFRAEKTMWKLDSERSAKGEAFEQQVAAMLGSPLAVPYSGAVHERVMASIYRAMIHLERYEMSDARAALAKARGWREAAVAGYAAESAAIEQTLAGILARRAPAAADLTRYFANSRFFEQFVKDSSFRGYGDFVNPYALYFDAVVALWLGEHAAAIEGLKATATVLPQNRQVAAEAVYFAKHREVSNRVCVLIENGTIARLTESRVSVEHQILGAGNAKKSAGKSAKKSDEKSAKDGKGSGADSARLEFAIPTLDPVTSKYDGFRANVPGNEAPFYSEVLANMDAVARAEYNRRLPVFGAEETARAVLRALPNVHTRKGDAPVVTEPVADTRQWITLPRDVHLITFNMPADRTFTLTSTHGTKAVTVKIPECRNAIVIWRVPTSVSEAPEPRVIPFH